MLCCAVLCCTVLCDVLCCAVMCCVVLFYAVQCCAVLCLLCCAVLYMARCDVLCVLRCGGSMCGCVFFSVLGAERHEDSFVQDVLVARHGNTVTAHVHSCLPCTCVLSTTKMDRDRDREELHPFPVFVSGR